MNEKASDRAESVPVKSSGIRGRSRSRRPRKRNGGTPADDAAVHRAATPETEWDSSSFRVVPKEGFVRFQDIHLPDEILRAVQDLGFEYCTPIQAELLPLTLKGRDAAGKAQTGTGKTAAFLITALARMLRNPPREPRRHGTPRTLIVAPTRELVIQIHKDAVDLGKYCPFKSVAVYGGMHYDRQQRELAGPVDLVAATPGRLLDYARRGVLNLGEVEVLVLDEADRMLDMGFIPDVRRIIQQTPRKEKRQTLLFGATITGDIERLASRWMTDPVSVAVDVEKVTPDAVRQIVYVVTVRQKLALLLNILLREKPERAIVFANRRDQTRRLEEKLRRYGIRCALLSGEVPQKKRLRTLEDFREGRINVLVATDVAGRGLHVEGISHVINYTIPYEPEEYVHRVGRTGRAGAVGTSISFACEADSFAIPEIEELLDEPLKCTRPDDEWLEMPPLPPGAEERTASASPARRVPRRRSGGRRRR